MWQILCSLFVSFATRQQTIIKLCPRGAQTYALPLFGDRDVDPITFKVEVNLDILQTYLHIENKAANLRHSKLGA